MMNWDFHHGAIAAKSQPKLQVDAITTMVVNLVVQNKILVPKAKETATITMTVKGIWFAETVIVIMPWDFHLGLIVVRSLRHHSAIRRCKMILNCVRKNVSHLCLQIFYKSNKYILL